MSLIDRRSPLPKVVYIDYSATNRDLAQLKSLSYLDQIRELRIDAAKVTDEGYACLAAARNLRTLRMGGATVTDAVLRHLTALENLEELDLSSFTKVKGHGLAHLRTLSQLRRLHIGTTDLTDGTGFAALAELPELKHLEISLATVNEAVLAGLCRLKQLETLRLWNLRLDGSVCAAGFANLSHLEVLAVAGSFPLGNELVAKVLPHLSGHAHLHDLSIQLSLNEDDLMAFVGQIPNLERLDLASSKINDAALDHLKGLKKLQKIQFACDTSVSSSALAKLKQAMPGLEGEIPQIDYSP